MTAPREAGGWRRQPELPAWSRRIPRVRRVARTHGPDTRMVVASYAMSMLSGVLLVLALNVTLVSQLQHFTAQHRLYDELRLSLAEGSTPIGQTVDGELVKPGTPLALLSIPELGIREVVVEGTASRQTKIGVGHRPDTSLPGQSGSSVLMGRAAAYGGVFGDLDKLKPGQTFTVTTGQGKSTYRVIGQRTGDTKLPAITGDAGRLTLVTASGMPFLPHRMVVVDADLVSKAFPRPPIAIAPGLITDAQKPLASDLSRLSSLAWLLELLVLLAAGATWAWKRLGQRATWIVFAPMIAATGFACADRVCDLLPNLM